MSALDFPPVPTTESEVTTGDITWKWNGYAWYATNQAGDVYLSKVTDDTAAGLITFQQGLSVTGGFEGDIVNGIGSRNQTDQRVYVFAGGSVPAQFAFDGTTVLGWGGVVAGKDSLTIRSDQTASLTGSTNLINFQGRNSGDASSEFGKFGTVLEENAGASGGKAKFSFHLNSGGGIEEKASISSSGELFIGKGNPSAAADTYARLSSNRLLVNNRVNSAGIICRNVLDDNSASASFIQFESANDVNNPIGSIRHSGDRIGITGLAGGPLMIDEGADARQITSTEAIANASAVVQQLQPVKINGTRHGFAAEALQPLIAEAVTGTAGATEVIGTYTDSDGNEETEVIEPQAIAYGATWTQTGTRDLLQGVDQTKLIPLLTKALQEALDRIEQLESNTLQPLYATLADLPSATDHHGKVAHVHSEGALYFAHAGNWVKLQNA